MEAQNPKLGTEVVETVGYSSGSPVHRPMTRTRLAMHLSCEFTGLVFLITTVWLALGVPMNLADLPKLTGVSLIGPFIGLLRPAGPQSVWFPGPTYAWFAVPLLASLALAL